MSLIGQTDRQTDKHRLQLYIYRLYALLVWYISSKGIESLPQTLIFKSLYLNNPMLYTLDISNYDFFYIKQSKFEISKVYIIWL